MNPLFEAVVVSAEEAIINSLVAAETMHGIDGHWVPGLAVRRANGALPLIWSAAPLQAGCIW
jgi:L-aminopeptidase/D-esterase-like protein